MSSGSREILQYAPETVIGTTPSPFARTTLAFTDTTLNAAVTKEDSATKLATRLAQQGTITAVDYTGDINAELRYGVYDSLIAACAYNAWVIDSPAVGSDTLTFGGTTKSTFSILRGFDDIVDYHTFRGVYINSMTLTIPETGIITISFGCIGLGREHSITVPLGTVTEPTLTDPFSNISVTDIQIDGVTTVGVACVKSLTFTWDNNGQPQRCLGNGENITKVIETLANGSGSFDMSWSTKGVELFEGQFTNTPIRITASFTDGGGNSYVLDLPVVEATGELPTGSYTDDLTATFEFRTIEQAPTLTRTPA